MPKGFSELEMKHYREKLLEVGTELFGTKGISGVSIDEIVTKVGIAKGSFYKFFKNKEDLCYDCLMKLEGDTRKDVETKLSKYKENPGELMKQLVSEIPEIIKKYPLIKIFQNPKDMQSLMLRVDPEKHQANFDGDTQFIGSMLNDTSILEKTDKESLTGFIWVLVFISLNENFFNGQFENVIKLLGNMASSHFQE